MVRHPDFGGHSRRDGRREFTYAPSMGIIDRRLHHRAAARLAWVALACCTSLGALLSPGLASTAASGNSEPGLADRLGEIAGSAWGKAESCLIAPARQSAAAVLADPRTEAIYRHLSATAQDLVGLADTHVVQPISRGSAGFIDRWGLRGSYGKVMAIASDLAEQLRLAILDPFIAGLKRAGERAMGRPPIPDAASPRLASVDPRAAALAIPGLPESDFSRYLNDDDPLEGFNRLMFRLNGGLQAKLLGPVSELYRDHTSPDIQLGVGNFFRNLREPATFVSSALEGQLDDAGIAAARFGINTTLGIAGFRDPATEFGYAVRPRNLEETLCAYKLPSGPYLVLPVLGPATLRDAAGRLATVVMYYEVMGTYVYFPYRITDITVQYANVKQKIDALNQLSPDPYRTQKALYLALRDLSCGEQAVTYREFFAK
jgi:phospholipid-binding lipoprotein MlaA